jgi:hypothetical protein
MTFAGQAFARLDGRFFHANTVDFLDRLDRFDTVTQKKYRALVRNLRFRK